MKVPDRQRGIINVKAKQRPLSMKDGKISVSMSLKGCRQCERLNNQMIVMRKEIVRLNHELQVEKVKNKQMDILCEEISKTKQRLLSKLQNKGTPGNVLRGNNTLSTIKLGQNHYQSNARLKLIDAMWYNQ